MSTPLHPDPFHLLPELAGRIIAPEDSALRVTDAVLAQWDARAVELGLGPAWRMADDDLETSRRRVLADAGAGDLWIFAYGSLMWDPGIHFTEVRRALVPGFLRRFSYRTTLGRGTVEAPGLVLSLEPGAGRCEGLAFRIDAAAAEGETRLFWRREMIVGGYHPQFVAMDTPQGPLRALALVGRAGHPSHAGGLSLEETAEVIRTARGSHGTNRDYLRQLVAQLERMGIRDDYVRSLATLVERP